MSGVEGGWRPYPGAPDVGATPPPPVEPGRVVGLGAVCDLGPTDSGEADREHETPERLTRDVLNAVLPDDDDPADDHPWSWLADLARARGLDVTAQDLRALPYEVVVTEELRRRLAR